MFDLLADLIEDIARASGRRDAFYGRILSAEDACMPRRRRRAVKRLGGKTGRLDAAGQFFLPKNG